MNDGPNPQTEASRLRQRTCPHCGKAIPKLPKKPRDLGLLLHCLVYNVPLEAEVTPDGIERARVHCKMKVARLAELQAEPHARHWRRMIERRAARLAYFKQYGQPPPRWMGLLPGEPDHLEALEGMRRYRKGGLAKLRARMRKHPNTAEEKLANRYRAAKRIRSAMRRSVALDDITARLVAKIGVNTEKLTLRAYEVLKSGMLPDDALPRRFRKKKDTGTGFDGQNFG